MKIYVTEIEKNGDIFGEEFRNSKKAIDYLKNDWSHMTEKEQEKSQFARVSIYNVNEDDEYKFIDTVFEIK